MQSLEAGLSTEYYTNQLELELVVVWCGEVNVMELMRSSSGPWRFFLLKFMSPSEVFRHGQWLVLPDGGGGGGGWFCTGRASYCMVPVSAYIYM